MRFAEGPTGLSANKMRNEHTKYIMLKCNLRMDKAEMTTNRQGNPLDMKVTLFLPQSSDYPNPTNSFQLGNL